MARKTGQEIQTKVADLVAGKFPRFTRKQGILIVIVLAMIGGAVYVVSGIWTSEGQTRETAASGVANTAGSNSPALSISDSPGAAIHYNAPSDEQLKYIIESVIADAANPSASASNSSSAGGIHDAKRFLADSLTAEAIHQAYVRDERIEDKYLDHWIPPPGWSGVVWLRAKESAGRWYFVFRQEEMGVAIHVWAGEEVAQLVRGDRVTVHGRIKDVRTGVVVLDNVVTARER